MRENKNLSNWKSDLRERGLLVIVRGACRRHSITLAELFGHRSTRAVVGCRRDLANHLRAENKSYRDIGRTLGLDVSQVAYCLKGTSAIRGGNG